MQFIDRTTGEIVEVVPYRPKMRRYISSSYPRQSWFITRQSRCTWCRAFVHLLPVLVGLVLVWALLTLAK